MAPETVSRPVPAAQQTPPAVNQVGKAITLMMLGVAIFSVMDVMVKWEGAIYPVSRSCSSAAFSLFCRSGSLSSGTVCPMR